MADKSSVKSFTPNSINIISLSGKVYDITSLCTTFSYYEDVDKPFVMAKLQIIDSGLNLIKTLPIQGGEDVEIDFDVPGSTGKNTAKLDKILYKFKVWKVYNRQFDAKVQIYHLALISEEAFLNEIVRVTKRLEGSPDEIVENLLKKYLKTDKNLSKERAGNKLIFYPSRRNITSIISSIQLRSRSEKATPINVKPKTSTTTETKFTSDNGNSDAFIAGTAGYLFFENKNGFVFKSIDTLCAVGTKGNFTGSDVIASYYSRPVSKEDGDIGNFFVIQRYRFIDEIDIVEKFRRGVYSTKMVFYNVSTGDYEEFNYSLKETFDSMVKLGYQDSLPEYQIRHGDYPSRVMSMIVDHETWHKKESVADPVQGGDADYPDESRYLIAQGLSRRDVLEFQKLEITIPGNSNLVVGEKIKVYLPNMAEASIRKTDPWDKESSGNYLISKLSHNYLMANEPGPVMTTVLELIRDTYGMEEEPSGVK